MKELTNRQCIYAKKLLECIAAHQQTIEYNELASMVGVSPQTVGKDIGEVSKHCHKLGLPLISGMVVNKQTRFPDIDGFGGLCRELNVYNEHKNNYTNLFAQCLKDIHECDKWYIFANYLNIKIDGISR